MGNMNLTMIAGIVGIIFLVIGLIIVGNFFSLWFQALMSKADVSLVALIGMRFRKVPARVLVEAKIMGIKAGLPLSTEDLEAHYMAGGHVMRVVQALIAADKANIPLNFKRAAAIDLAGRNVLEAVQMSVLPKVIETPKIAAVAKDGIQLIVVSRVTVRTNIDRLVRSEEHTSELQSPCNLVCR